MIYSKCAFISETVYTCTTISIFHSRIWLQFWIKFQWNLRGGRGRRSQKSRGRSQRNERSDGVRRRGCHGQCGRSIRRQIRRYDWQRCWWIRRKSFRKLFLKSRSNCFHCCFNSNHQSFHLVQKSHRCWSSALFDCFFLSEIYSLLSVKTWDFPDRVNFTLNLSKNQRLEISAKINV